MNSPVQKLSAAHSTFVKRVLPFITVAAVSAWTYQSRRHEPNALVMTAMVGLIGLGLMWWFVLRRDFWRLADVVEQHGDRLVITRWTTKVEIPIANVKQLIRVPSLAGGSAVTLVLTTPSALGSEISFLAPSRRTMRDIDEKLEALARRVKAQS
jgi:hypothetical protein